MPDQIKITIMPDGMIKSETDQISMPNHANAGNFLKEMARLAGGILNIVQRPHKLTQDTHTHNHLHQ